MLWSKFSFGAKLLKLVQFLFSFLMYSLPKSGIMANKIETSSKSIKSRINLDHNHKWLVKLNLFSIEIIIPKEETTKGHFGPGKTLV